MRTTSILLLALLMTGCGRAPQPTAAPAAPSALAARAVGTDVEEKPALPGALARSEVAFEAASRTDAAGKVVAAGWGGGPVYITPRDLPVILPGAPAPLPRFVPRPIDLSQIPIDAFEALAQAGRLRDAKKSALPWLFGQTFPKLTAAEARAAYAAGRTVWLSPDASSWHRDKIYTEIPTAGLIEAMLPELQRAAREKLQGQARLANIKDRQAILMPFNGTYDIWKLWALDAIIPGYRPGQPIRRLSVAAALLYEREDVRRLIATYWEDHPDLSAGELRQVTDRYLRDALATIARRTVLAEDPAHYRDAQVVPGLRDPRPKGPDGWSREWEEDVTYNRQVLRELGQLAATALPLALYP